MEGIRAKCFVLIVLMALLSMVGYGQATNDTIAAQPTKLLSHGNKGFIFTDRSGDYLMNLEFRGQFRLSYPTDTDPILLSDYENEQVKLGIKRARLKVGGHSFKPWFKYYLEYELFSSNLLDFRLMYEKVPWLKVKVGQWKVQYNRERIISSGKQQTADRSILTRIFTVDRQQGVSVFGHIEGQGVLNLNYWVSTFMGTGRGNIENDDKHLMYMTRIQWNYMGRTLNFSGSDLEYHEKFTGLVALAGVTNQSPYTRFSQSGGGQLEGYDEGISGQYRVNQLMLENAWKYKGFSWQQELHYKQILDHVNSTETELAGNLIQIGYFLHHLLKAIPANLELYTRHAFFLPDISLTNQLQNEVTMGCNWFFFGHRLKFTGEASHITSNYNSGTSMDGWRYRLQLDVSF